VVIILGRHFYERDTIIVARELLGKLLVHTIGDKLLSGIIVETEAYRASDDPASHAYCGKTARNEPMFGSVGYSYVYFVYGNHFCLNIVAKAKGQEAGAVLIRAVEPVDGLAVMRRHRNQKNDYLLSNGPGKLTQALGISRQHNARDLICSKELYVVDSRIDVADQIVTSPRIGIKRASVFPWRFYLKTNRWVSK